MFQSSPAAVRQKLGRPKLFCGQPRRWITPAGPIICSPSAGPATDIQNNTSDISFRHRGMHGWDLRRAFVFFRRLSLLLLCPLLLASAWLQRRHVLLLEPFGLLMEIGGMCVQCPCGLLIGDAARQPKGSLRLPAYAFRFGHAAIPQYGRTRHQSMSLLG
jgi:hypothetical protein